MKSAFKFFVPAAHALKIERIKLVTTFFIYNLHHMLYGYKPFNPILGETFQCEIKSEDDSIGNIKLYCEQISHHPPIFNFYAKHELFTIWGYRATTVNGGGNSITASINGRFNIQFNDDAVLTFKYGQFVMSGLLFGQRSSNFKGNFVVEDKKNGLISLFEINPKEKQSFMGKLFGKSKENFPDYFKGYIAQDTHVVFDSKSNTYKVDENGILSNLEGEFMTHANFDNKSYWSSDENFRLADQYKMNFTLPSDSLLREDVLLYKKGRLDLAQYAKMMLEDIQRKDDKLRKAKVKKN